MGNRQADHRGIISWLRRTGFREYHRNLSYGPMTRVPDVFGGVE